MLRPKQGAAKPGSAATPAPLQTLMKRCKGPILFAMLFSGFINLLMLAPSLYMMQIYDRVLQSRSETTLVMLTLILIFGLLTMALLEVVRSRVLVRVGGRIDEALSASVFEATLKNHVRNAAQRTQPLNDIAVIRQFAGGAGLLAFFDLPWMPAFLTLLFLMHPLLGAVSLTGGIILLILAIASEASTRKRLSEATGHNVAAANFAETSIKNGDAMSAMGMMQGIFARWKERHDKALSLQGQASDWAGVLMNASKVTRIALQSLMLAAGAYLAIEGKISPGVMIAASIIGAKALSPLEVLIANWGSLVSAQLAWKRIKTLLIEAPPAPPRMTLPTPEGNLSVSRIIAAPPGMQVAVLQGVSFDLAAGESLGIIGPSGSGKSTLARVITGVWPSVAGTVRLDGAELAQWPKEQLGPHIGYLPQDIDIFDGTVAENIARLGHVDSEAVVAAARQAGIHDLILQLPEGYNTQIGESGNRLSGGQRQRIGLARAIYRMPALCVFDEPNSNLDEEGEQHLVQTVLNLKKSKRTALIITHRPSVLNHVDKVLVMKAGQVTFFGSRAEAFAKFARPVAAPEASQIATR